MSGSAPLMRPATPPRWAPGTARDRSQRPVRPDAGRRLARRGAPRRRPRSRRAARPTPGRGSPATSTRPRPTAARPGRAPPPAPVRPCRPRARRWCASARSTTPGLTSNWVQATVRLDRTAPTAPTVSGGSPAWQNVASLSLSASGSTDAGGAALSGYEYATSTDGGTTWSAPQSGSSTSVSAEGQTLVRFRAVDGAGNSSSWVQGTAQARPQRPERPDRVRRHRRPGRASPR